jgi:preprotein translocase subunit SecA
MILLQVMDTAWVEHLTYLEQLRKGIFLRAYGQKDPLVEFQREGFNLFTSMMERIREETLEFLFRLQGVPRVDDPAPRVMVEEKPSADGGPPAAAPAAKAAPLIATARLPGGSAAPAQPAAPKGPSATAVLPEIKKIGRNDPCPCGSGKKYKKCCGK